MPQYKPNKDGYYRKSIVVGKLPNGCQKREVVRSKSLSEFKVLIDEAETRRKHGYDFSAKKMNVREWSAQWLEVYKRPKVTARVAAAFESDLNLHILPKIGHLALTDVKHFHLQKILNKFEGKSKSHAQKIRVCLHQLFSRAYVDGLILTDIAGGLEMPDTTEGFRRPLTPEERTALEKVCRASRAGTWALTMLYAALRPEETVALMWGDIDLTPGAESITVWRAAGYEDNRPEIKEVKGKKNKKGKETERTIPIPAELAGPLRELKKKKRGMYVFPPAESDGMMTKTNLRRMWHTIRREVDIAMGAELYRNQIIKHVFDQDVSAYYLRHTCCTHWFEMGLDLKTVQYLMGHSDIKTTANIYMHFVGASAERAGDIIRGKIKTDAAGEKTAE